MRQLAQRFLGFLLPGALNAGLALWVLWHLATVPGYARHIGFGAFVWLYAIGGLTIVLSCASAFFLLAADGGADAARRRHWLTLALINTTIPSIFMLLLLLLR